MKNILLASLLCLCLHCQTPPSLGNSTSPPSTFNLTVPQTGCTIFYTQSSSSLLLDNCTGSSFMLQNWPECRRMCCVDPRIVSDQFTKQDLQRCGGNQNIQESRTMVIQDQMIGGTSNAVLIVFASFGGAVGLYCLIVCCIKKCNQQTSNNAVLRPQTSTAVKITQPELTTVQWPQQKLFNYKKGHPVIWSYNSSKTNKIDPTQVCVICLDQQTTCKLVCGHQYHPKCIRQWLMKNVSCPCCRKFGIKGVKIYCQKCLWRQYVLLALFWQGWILKKYWIGASRALWGRISAIPVALLWQY